MADQISDAVLDAIISEDINARVACETLVKTGIVLVAGEITTSAGMELEQVIRKVITGIGYNRAEVGFNGETCAVLSAIGKQSPDIAIGVDKEEETEQGAGDQGMMVGYATNETDALMPAPVLYAHRLMMRQTELRKKEILPWLRPDGKSQITFRYENGRPSAIEAVVVSVQHDPDIKYRLLREAVMDEIVMQVLPPHLLHGETKFFINPTGRFVVGGPVGDCGVTGRKIVVDTYGGMARHGGGCFSGKDPSKVDRSASYACRYITKNIVAAGLADRCEIQISYAIGVAEPTSISINTYGTGNLPDEKIERLVVQHFDLRPYGLVEMLDLLRPIYLKTAAYGHFGREDEEFTWERTDKAEELKEATGL